MASCGRGNLIDDIKGGDQSHGKKEKGKNKNKENNKQKGQTSFDPRTGTPDTTKSETFTTVTDGKSVHPETSKAETETENDPKEAASPPSLTKAEDVEEFSEDQQKKPCGETPVTPIGVAGDDQALQQEHGSTPSSGDTSPKQGDDNEAQDDNNEKTPQQDTNAQTDDANVYLEDTMDKNNERQKEMEDEIRRIEDELAKQKKEHETTTLGFEADIRSITEAYDKLNFEKKGADEHVKQLLDKIEELREINKTKDKEIEKLRVGIKAHEASALNIMKRIQEEANKNSRLESTVANLKEDYSKLHKEKTRMDEELKNFKSQVSKQKTLMEDYQSTIKKIRKEKEDAKQQSEKEYRKLKEEKEKNEKQFGKDRTKLTLRNSELEATVNNKNREHEAECKRLNQTISKGKQQLNQYYAAYTQSVTEVSRLNAEVEKLKKDNHDIYSELKQQITSLRKTIHDLEKQKEDLMLRLSKIAGANLTYNNPNIADLSDEKRPTKLAEEFSELYDNEWTDAFEEVEAVDDKSRTKFLYDVLKRASEYCTDLSTGHDDAIKRSFTTLKYEVTVPTTEVSEPVVDTTNDLSEAAKAEKVDKQENDKDTTNDAIEAVPMNNEDKQDHDKINNVCPSADETPKGENGENKEEEDFYHVTDKDVAGTKGVDATSTKKEDEPKTELGDYSNNEDGTDENAGAHVGNNNNSPEQNTETEKDQDTSKDSNDDDSKTQDEQCMNPQNTTDEEPDGITGIGEGTNTSSVDQTTEDGQKAMPNEEPKEIPKKDEALNSPEQTTSQGGDENVDLEETSNGDQAKESGAMAEDKKGDDAEDASLLKGGKTTPINNHDDTVEGEKDDASVDGLEGSSTLDGNNATIDTKLKGEGENTGPPRNKNTETVNETNGDALGTSVDEIKDNSRPHGKEKTETKVDGNNSETNPQGEEKGTDVDQKANGNTNATNLQNGDTNQSSADTQSGNKQPTTKTIEISKIDFNFDDLSKEQLKMIMDLKKECEVQQSKDVKSNGARIIADAMNVSEESEEMMKYILKCIDICWSMHRHDPPVHINFTSHVDGQPFDKNVYRPYTKSGKHIDYVVWPSLHLHKGGPMLGKGVAQGK